MLGTPSAQITGAGSLSSITGGGEGWEGKQQTYNRKGKLSQKEERPPPWAPLASEPPPPRSAWREQLQSWCRVAQRAVCSGSEGGSVRMNGQRTPLLPRGKGCSSLAWNWAVPSETVKVAVT